MAVSNKLTESKTNQVIEYDASGEKVKLSPAIIKQYLVSGGGNVSDQEVVMFLNLCRFQHLNPFLREAYLIKYGNQPATMVAGKEAFTKRARRNADYKGQKAGVIVLTGEGQTDFRVGTFYMEGEKVVGGWAKIFIDGYVEPVEITVPLEEYIGTKKDGEVNSQWAKRPATMIRKVALVQALREAFPEDFAGMYAQEEMDIQDVTLPETPVELETAQSETPIEPAFEDPLA